MTAPPSPRTLFDYHVDRTVGSARTAAWIWNTTIRVVSLFDTRSRLRVWFWTALPVEDCRRFNWTIEETIEPPTTTRSAS